jgi:ABC-type nitrate/sulfonate/bicarbonate transport system permease component
MTEALSRPTDAWLRVLSLLGCLGVWHVAARLGEQPLLPTPAVVLASLWHHPETGEH